MSKQAATLYVLLIYEASLGIGANSGRRQIARTCHVTRHFPVFPLPVMLIEMLKCLRLGPMS